MLNDKQLDKVHNKLGKTTIEELDKLNEADLKKRIVEANAAMKQAEDELEANEKYQELKRSKRALEQGKKEVNARQKAIIQYCLHLLEEKGKPVEAELSPFEKADKLMSEATEILSDAISKRANNG